jgi:Flp pilus assembly pilin Flp
MLPVLRQLWADDDGAIISVEFLLITSVLIFGLIPGLVAFRNSVGAMFATLGNLITRLVPSFSFSGFQIVNNATTPPTVILSIGGISFTPDPPATLTALNTPPVPLSPDLQVSPAP